MSCAVAASSLEACQERFLELRGSVYMDYPFAVSMETMAYCNARCHFCPYPGSDRMGDQLPDSLIEKIVGDLADIPSDVPLRLNLSRMNEPFVDPRLLDICEMINVKIPHAKLFYFTNGSPLDGRKIEHLARLNNVEYVNIPLTIFVLRNTKAS
jgi:MoaA/NifB/PqqE/SkfB family radical SAM enzyme